MPVSDNAATFLGIGNENEFYSAHYLAEVFKGDISELLNTWKAKEENEESYQAPFNRLKAISRDYFSMRERSNKERNHSKAITMQRQFFRQWCNALDIPWNPQNRRVTTDKKKDDFELPVLAVVPNSDGPKLWVLGALDSEKDGTDPLLLELKKDQFIGEGPHGDGLKNSTWYELINDVVFKQDEPPRWVMLLSDRQCILIDRYKWLQNRLLRFDLDEILGRKDNLTLQATAALLHVESLVPEQGSSLLDNLDENSHKHAFGVSEDLKYALREAIELLGNEAAEQLIQRKDISFTGKSALDADELSRECLRYMYRLLFLFYIEARPELKYVPHQSEAYRKGYSLESLRDLELVKLTTEESRKGYYLHHSISLLFKLIHEGYKGEREVQLGDAWQERGVHNSFTLEKLDSHLFDPKRTPYLNKVKFTNQTLQTVIRLMSLTRETSGRGRKRRGRVSYAQLGINQLGAVYEALLSYRGFFASEDLYEVQKPGENYNELETGYFVPAQEIENYTEDEKVYVKDENGSRALKMHEKGKFIYRLAGRDRQKSASYYTPEVLTKCLVKYTLKERLKGLKADEILKLTICEPAMGSAAFLNEAVNQLSEAYLTLKQQELNKRISHEEYREALQQVKMHIADHNVYGVDLNPIAVELAEVSLWLNALSQSSVVPWFGYQLFNGNSLIGARRQVYRPDQLVTRRTDDKWYKHEPSRLDPFTLKDGSGRDADHIYHFLLPDEGMVGVSDAEAKKLKPDAFEKIKQWKKRFLQPLTLDEVKLLQQISGAIDKLWKEHTDMLRADRSRTEDRFAVWGQPNDEYHISTQQKDQIRSAGIFNNNAKIASPYRRLKLVMDYWCALWFWPLDKVDLLPDRSSWLFELNLLLQGQVFNFKVEQSRLNFETDKEDEIFPNAGQHGLFSEDNQQLLLTEDERKARQVKTAKGELHLERLLEQFPRLSLANRLAETYRFFHWELSFADVFSDKGGFDIMLGNPPWLKYEWSVTEVLSDIYPELIIHGASTIEVEKKLNKFLSGKDAEEIFWAEKLCHFGAQSFLSANQNYELLSGIKVNLFKNFIVASKYLTNSSGCAGLLHPNGVFTDSNGDRLRADIYKRLRYHFQVQNQLMFFPIPHRERYSLCVYSGASNQIQFDSISNLFHPATIDRCFSEDSNEILAFKDSSGRWEQRGNKNRIIKVDMDKLGVISKFFESDTVNCEVCKLPSLNSVHLFSVIEKLVENKNISNLGVDIESSVSFHETYSVRDGFLSKISEFQDVIVIKGPHFYVANPLYKTPRSNCKNKADYDVVNLKYVPSNYIQRSNFKVLVDVTRISLEDPLYGVDEKIIFRRRLPVPNERTLISALFPGDYLHTHQCISMTFGKKTLLVGAYCSSIVFDFIVKIIGKEDLYPEVLKNCPIGKKFVNEISLRYLRLCCINDKYSMIWMKHYKPEFKADCWSIGNLSLKEHALEDIEEDWSGNNSLTNDFARRQALLELDVLVSQSLGLTYEELLTLYRIQFPVLKQNDNETFYDATGQIVFTSSKGLPGVGLSRKPSRNDDFITIEYPSGISETKQLGWEDVCPDSAPIEKGRRVDYASGKSFGKPKIPDGTKIHRTVIDDTLPGGPRKKVITYVAPFYLPDREEDYRVAWDVFSERFAREDSEGQNQKAEGSMV